MITIVKEMANDHNPSRQYRLITIVDIDGECNRIESEMETNDLTQARAANALLATTRESEINGR